MLICASAIGYYGYDRGDQTLTEDSERGDGFLADVVDDWELAATTAEEGGARVVRVRTGIVQTPSGGTLRLQLPLFRAGLGGRLGDGQQWFSYIGIDDLVDIYHRALWDTALSGPVNAVAVDPVRNSDYTRTLAKVLRRPAVVPVPPLGAAAAARRAGRPRSCLRQPTGAAGQAATSRPPVSSYQPRPDAAAPARPLTTGRDVPLGRLRRRAGRRRTRCARRRGPRRTTPTRAHRRSP